MNQLYAYTCPFSLEPPSHSSPLSTQLGHHGAELSSLLLSVLCIGVYTCQCYSVNSSHPPLPLPLALSMSVLYVCIYIPALQIGSLEQQF